MVHKEGSNSNKIKRNERTTDRKIKKIFGLSKFIPTIKLFQKDILFNRFKKEFRRISEI